MKKLIFISCTAILLTSPILHASSSEEKLDNLTKEQTQTQKEIQDQVTKISDAQAELDTINSTIASNKSKIETLNGQVKAKQEDIDNQTDNLNSTFELLQKMNNSNVMLEYLTSDNQDNFLLKYGNVVEVSGAIQGDIKTFISDLQQINSDLSSIESYNVQNESQKQEASDLLADQKQAESDLKSQLATIDTSILDVQDQISLEEAQALQAEQEKAQAEALAKAEAKADKEAKVEEEQDTSTSTDNNTDPTPDTGGDTVDNGGDTTDNGGDTTDNGGGSTSVYPSNGDVSGYKSQLMAAAGISSSDYDYVDYIITKESSWNYLADNPYSSAYGICQALPGSKMASAGSDWATNPETQLSWCNSYAVASYGSWEGAYNFWIEHNWW